MFIKAHSSRLSLENLIIIIILYIWLYYIQMNVRSHFEL